MQRIERYGVIALVLLLVTIAAVSFWEEPTKPSGEKQESVAKVSKVLPKETPRDADRQLPTTARPSAESRARDQRARKQQREQQLARQAELERQRRLQDEQRQLAADRSGVEVLDFPDALKSSANEEPVVVAVNTDSKPVVAPVVVQAEPKTRSSKMRVEPVKKSEESEPASAGGVYVVKANETLSEIALKTLGSSKRWPELAALNGGSDRITEGQKLRLPGATLAAAKPAPKSSPVKSPKSDESSVTPGGIYVVQKGDMLSVIAQTELGSARRWREIAKLNPKVDPDRLLEGTRLVMPGGSGGATKVAKSSTSKAQRSSSSRSVR